MKNNQKPEIRITKDHRSCNCCGAQNYRASSDRAETRHVDTIYEVAVGHMVNALCPNCLNVLGSTALVLTGTQPGETMRQTDVYGIRYRDINGNHYELRGSRQDIYLWALEEMTEEDEVLEVFRGNICLYSALQTDKDLTSDELTGFFG